MSFKKQWIILYFILLTIIGSLGFYFIGGDEWTILDSIFMTIITLSTIGAQINNCVYSKKLYQNNNCV